MQLLQHIGIESKDCVEIGVHEGEFASAIMACRPRSLRLVDPWKYYGDGTIICIIDTSQADYDARYKRVCAHFLSDPRVTIVRSTSVDAAMHVDDRSLDFVHVDGNHNFMYAIADLCVWYPKLRVGGWIAMHDMCAGYPGVLRAYGLFTTMLGIDAVVQTTKEYNASFAFRKKT